jgi:ankyrin repeat protein
MNKKQNFQIFEAIFASDLSTVRKLLAEGSDLSQLDSEQCFTPLMQAINLGEVEIVQVLLEAGADIHFSPYFEDTPLGLAALTENLEIVKLLLKFGANPDNGGECPPLYWAVEHKNIKMIQLLLEAGANINGSTPSHITCLMKASLEGYLNIVKYLVESGANTRATDENGNTALIKAAFYGHQEVFDYLFEITDNIEEKNYAQQLLNLAIRRNQR